MKGYGNAWSRIGVAMLIVVAATLVGVLIWRFGGSIGLVSDLHKLCAFLSIMFIGIIGGTLPRMLAYLEGRQHRDQSLASGVLPSPDGKLPSSSRGVKLPSHMSALYGPFWHRRARLLLVIGEPDEVTAIAPGLSGAQWLEGEGVVLLWGGSGQEGADEARLDQWRRLRSLRPLDGIVWAFSEQQGADADYLARYQQRLRAIARRLRWQAPLHLWEVRRSEWQQPAADVAVGCTLPSGAGPVQLESRLSQLLPSLREQGLARMQGDNRHDFLLRLAQGLKADGIARWQQAWAQLQRGAELMPRGLWFSLALPGPTQAAPHLWLPHPTWRGILADAGTGGRPHGWTWSRTASTALLGLAAICGVGMLVSFVGNRAQIAEMQAVLATLDQPREGDEPLLALDALVHELDRLDHRARHGVPLHQRFGLSRNDGLLAALWPRYEAANNRLVRDPAAAGFERQLRALLSLAPGSPERAARARDAYEPLKAYLMMARPENVDAAFLGKALAAAGATRVEIDAGTWQDVAPNLWRFYAEHLGAHPGWRINPDPGLVARARQLLVSQLGQRNGESTLYQQVLDAVANQYPALGLQQMVGDTDAQLLFSTAAEVPGVFTRQAWEGGVRKAIEEIAAARREEIDWVLSDDRSQIAAELTPEVLRERLVGRYFQDYGRAWLDVLNSLRWHEAGSLADAVDQLTLMTDVRQSPLIALVNTLSYQGQAGTRTKALGDSLLQSAQNLIGQDPAPVIDQLAGLPKSPLDDSFGPLLALLGKAAEQGSDDSLSLHAFLTRVTRVRLTLQQVSAAPDPQARVQALAQTVFQGRSIDLTDTRSYGSLIAASLGSEWSGFGRALFVQPLEQAWQRILQPSAAGLNGQWQRAIVGPWNGAFGGRYPFAASAADASLPMLGQMIRSDTGRIDQFLSRQLGGVLRKEGNRWVPESAHSQGLRFNPDFLEAINQLTALADVLYTDGGMGIGFELRAKPVRDLVQTTLTLDGNRLAYFNQRERWQRFDWPGMADHPGARLSWTHARSGERLLGDYPGTWGLIRLLEQARVTPLDDSETRYRLLLETPDGLGLTWHLRTDLGAGPLALLQLRGFKLPAQIFLDGGGAALPLAHYGDLP